MSAPSTSDFAEALASIGVGAFTTETGIPAPIGALFLSIFFPSTSASPVDFQQLCQNIKQTVTDANIQNDIDLLKGNIQGFIFYVRGTYKGMKDNQDNKTLLFDGINNPWSSDMDKVVGTLFTNSDFVQAGFPVFLSAVGTFILMHQEMALVDPTVDDPWKSPSVNGITTTLNTIIPFAQKQWTQCQATRRTAISVQSSTDPDPFPGEINPPIPQKCYYWQDTVTNTQGGEFCADKASSDSDKAQAQAQAQAACLIQQQVAIDQLVKDNGSPDDIIAKWETIAVTPLPLPSAVEILFFAIAYHDTSSGEATLLSPATFFWQTENAEIVLLIDADAFQFQITEDLSSLNIGAAGSKVVNSWGGLGLVCIDIHNIITRVSCLKVRVVPIVPPSWGDSSVFDAKFYLKNSPTDLQPKFGADYGVAFDHWVNHGVSEGRRGSRVFDVQFYLNTHSDLKARFGTDFGAALDYWVTTGLPTEGQRGSNEFDVQFYLSNNSDLESLFGTNYRAALNHWLTNGLSKEEGRRGSKDFDVQFYLNTYPDLKARFGTDFGAALDYWITTGKAAGQKGAPAV